MSVIQLELTEKQWKIYEEVMESAHHTGAAANLPVEPFDHIVGTDTSPVFRGEIETAEKSV